MIVILFARPGEMSSHFDLPILIDEYILWTDVSDFLAILMEIVASCQKSIDEIPEFRLLKKFLLKTSSVSNLIGEHIREVVILDLDRI